MDFLTILQERRSIRKYTGEHVSDADLQEVLEAGLLSQSSRGRRPWELIVVRDREVLEKLSHCRDHGAAMLADADCAILVFRRYGSVGCVDGGLLHRHEQYAYHGGQPGAGKLLDSGQASCGGRRTQHRGLLQRVAGRAGAVCAGGNIVFRRCGRGSGTPQSGRAGSHENPLRQILRSNQRNSCRVVPSQRIFVTNEVIKILFSC